MIRSSKASTLWVMLVVVMEMACLISFIELEMTDKPSGSWFGLRSVSSTATYCWPLILLTISAPMVVPCSKFLRTPFVVADISF